VAVTKAHEGAWIIMLVIPIQVVLFRVTRAHYNEVAAQLTLTDWQPDQRHENRVIVPISGVQRAVVGALDYARTLSPMCAPYTSMSTLHPPPDTEGLGQMGPRRSARRAALPLSIVDGALLEYIGQLDQDHPNDYVTVVLPEFVPARWWHHLFHNQRALLIKAALLFKPHTIVTSVPFHLAR
jgi:hypothetical protein